MKKEIKKEWFLDRYCGQQFAALVEDGKLTEFSCEKEPRVGIVGNIYKGKITTVLSGMHAAFVNCNLGKNCYLSMEEMYTDCTKYDDATEGAVKSASKKLLNLKEGDEVIVQVTTPQRGTKGAKVSTYLSFVGKRLIYLPQTDFLGISRKITDPSTRETLLKIGEKLRANPDDGFILRTQAPFATPKQLKAEAEYLKKLYTNMLASAKNAPVGALLYEDDDLPTRVIRDSFGDEITAFHVGDETLHKRLLHLAQLRGDIPSKKLLFYNGERAMMQEYGISPLVYEMTTPTVSLENGGYLVIEHTEAMTVIDVNSGHFVGDKNLEETAFAVNLAAAEEIARQVRLRNIGGIIVVDFIDMTQEENRVAVTEALQKLLAKDNAKCNVLPMSELCLTQFTRKRVGTPTYSALSKPCPICAGTGHTQQDIFIVIRLREAILDCFANGYDSAIIDLNENIMKKILSENIFSIELHNRWKNKRIYFIPHKTYREECFSIRGDNAKILTLPNNAQLLY